VTLYLESSAVLAWLLGEPGGARVTAALAGATTTVASVLTLVECDRALFRAVAKGRVAEAEAARRRRELESVARTWNVSSVTAAETDRARRPFPREPVRTLDALHLAAALQFQRELGDVAVLALDQRVRDNAAALGLTVVP
jgi:uncharacterized protein with PIN domain